MNQYFFNQLLPKSKPIITNILFLIVLIFTMACNNSSISRSYRQIDETHITVMSYNVRRDHKVDYQPYEDSWKKRKKRVIQLIKAYEPDVVCIQEAKDGKRDYKDNHSSGQYDYLKKELKDLYDVKKGKRNDEAERCPIFYKKDKFILVQSGSLNIGDIKKSHNANRVCTFVKLRLQNKNLSNIYYYVFNVHYLKEDDRQLYSSQQLRWLLGKEGVTTDDGHDGLKLNQNANVIITGDFNCRKNSSPYNLLTDEQSSYSYPWPFVDSFLANYYNTTNTKSLSDYGATSHSGEEGWQFICEPACECEDEQCNQCNKKLPNITARCCNGEPPRCSNWNSKRIDFIFHSQNIRTKKSYIIPDNYWIDKDDITNDRSPIDLFIPKIPTLRRKVEGHNRASDHDPVLSVIDIKDKMRVYHGSYYIKQDATFNGFNLELLHPEVGKTKPKRVSFSIKNMVPVQLKIDEITLSGAPSFVLTKSPGQHTVPANGSTEFIIDFLPESEGTYTTTISITYDYTTYTIDIVGTATNSTLICIPNKPTNLTGLFGGGSTMTLSWQDNSDLEDGFKIYRRTASEESFIQIGEVTANNTTFSDHHFPLVNDEIWYRVCAYNYMGNSDMAALSFNSTEQARWNSAIWNFSIWE